MIEVKIRTSEKRLAPRRTRLEIPGWAGEREPRADGAQEYPWHCTPFSEGAQYGIELFYPYDNELLVGTKDKKLYFEGDFGPCPSEGLQWPPFRNFGEDYYTYQILLDMKVPPGYALRIEPHPRFYSDRTDTCPIAVQALVRNWWPMLFFIVFKSPAEGRVHIFRPGEPFAQVLILPEEAPFEIVEMGPDEAAERELQARRIHASRDSLGVESRWISRTNTVFDGTYRFMWRAAKAQTRRKEPADRK